MRSKSLRVHHRTEQTNLEVAIADLAACFLRSTKTGCRVVKEPTDFPLHQLCKPLIEAWQSDKLAYQPGEITLVFTEGELDTAADIVIYKPERGDRFLYTRRTPAPKRADFKQQTLNLEGDALFDIVRQLHTVSEGLAELAASQPGGMNSQALRDLLDAQTTCLLKGMAEQFSAFTQQVEQRLDQMQAQITQLAAQLELTDEPQSPHSEAEWRQRIQDAWGTVGDYEQYSASHREANAENPLFPTPDWVALCELEWARQISPTLATLYALMHEPDGIGEAGADILQQFGCHLDPRTGDRYYIYKMGGFNAYEALWQIASDRQRSWLPELQRLCQKLARHPEIFQMFGWEPEAIASLESVVERAVREREAGRQAYDPHMQQRRSGNTLSDYLAILNIGPFTPLTPEMIKRAYKQAMKIAHPDTGGSKEQAQRVNAAYEAVLRHYFPDAI